MKSETTVVPHQKTPWNPSRKALKRVGPSLPIPRSCPFCQSKVKISTHKEVYGKDYGDWPWVYRCEHCDAQVGMHPFTNLPLGTLADKELRNARKRCKAPFESLWRNQQMSRSEAYSALAEHLKISVSACHFGWFDAEQCEEARKWAASMIKR